MKLRIQGNRVRLRLSAAHVSQLQQTGTIVETLIFGPAEDQTFRYALTQTATENHLTATLSKHTITVYIPENIAANWTNSDLNGLDAIISNGQEKGLKLLREKDLDCFH